MNRAIHSFLGCQLAAASLAFLAPTRSAAVSPVPVPVPAPAGFGVMPAHSTQPVVYSESAGEALNTVNRASIEKVCAMRRSMDPATPTPVFEAGFDRPDVTHSVRFVAPQAWADYLTITGYACDPPTAGASKDVCGCTFRTHTSRFVHIRKSGEHGTEFIDADLARGTVKRRLERVASMAGASNTLPNALALGTIVGTDTVAGVACTVHRQDIGAGRLERCVADASNTTPAALRGQQLAHAHYLLRDSQALRQDWSRTRYIEQDARVDAGVFDAPAGLRESAPAPTKEAQ